MAGLALGVVGLGLMAWAVGLLGLVRGTRSPSGLAVFLVALHPSEFHRARNEEWALAAKFYPEWTAYAGRTGFFMPRPGRQSG